MEVAKQARRRKHGAPLKAQVLAQCAQPGASVARVALEHGLNANLVHRWRRIAEGREAGRLTVRPVSEFIALPIEAPTAAAPAEIRIELRRGAMSVSVTWPASAAAECAHWVRELLR